MKKVLIIGGTGTISTPITEALAQDRAVELYVLNRGSHNQDLPEHISIIQGDMKQPEAIQELIKDLYFDCVINFIVWNDRDAEQNVRLFNGRTKQFIYISTVCVLNRETECMIRERNPLGNAYSAYGQEKAAAEAVFLNAREQSGFPVTIVRPSQTYSKNRIPLSVKGKGCWPVVSRMLRGKEVIVHGDGQSVWASTHAEDFAGYFCSLVGDLSAIGEIYQIMNPESHTWDMIYQELAALLEVDYKPVYISTELLRHSRMYDMEGSIQGDKRWSNVFDISKIQAKVPDFKCRIDYRLGLKRYLEYMDAHPGLKTEEPEFDEWCDQTIALYKQACARMVEKI